MTGQSHSLAPTGAERKLLALGSSSTLPSTRVAPQIISGKRGRLFILASTGLLGCVSNSLKDRPPMGAPGLSMAPWPCLLPLFSASLRTLGVRHWQRRLWSVHTAQVLLKCYRLWVWPGPADLVSASLTWDRTAPKGACETEQMSPGWG